METLQIALLRQVDPTRKIPGFLASPENISCQTGMVPHGSERQWRDIKPTQANLNQRAAELKVRVLKK